MLVVVSECHSLGALVEFLAFHPPVLEPDLDLALAEVQPAGDLPALLARDVRVADELLLEDHRLVARVRLALLALTTRVDRHQTVDAHRRRLMQHVCTYQLTKVIICLIAIAAGHFKELHI